ncbi:MAG: DM13 domain-containing protein [Nitrosopumilaceae archaeon]
MNTGVKIGIIIGVIVIGIALASPLFYDVEVDEPLPLSLNDIEEDLTYEKFTTMNDEDREEIVEKMPDELKEMVMEKASTMIVPVSENWDEMAKDSDSVEKLKSGTFEGLAGHEAEGLAKIIQVNDMTFLRFENFQVTNGPDLRVYITPDGDVKNGIHLEKLKGSKGDQNYLLESIDVGVYDTVIIYCQPFGVYFGQAELM